VTDEKKKSTNFVIGLALGTAVAAGAAFLYKTKKGKKIRKHLEANLDDVKGFLFQFLKDIKLKAKKLESQIESSNQKTLKQTTTLKKKVKKTTDTIKKNVFLKSGKPLAK